MTQKRRITVRTTFIGLLFVFYFAMLYDGVAGFPMTGLLIAIGVLIFRNRRDINDYKKGKHGADLHRL